MTPSDDQPVPANPRAGEPCQLYLVTPTEIEPESFATQLAEVLDAAGPLAGGVQLRLKDVDDDAIRRAVAACKPVCAEREVPLILNDRPDLAAETGCDGVHIGQEDVPFSEARRLMGDDRIVGVTCHDSRHLAIEASEAGADYVAFGAFFPTRTKEPKSQADPEVLRWWSEMTIVPCVAIGGITADNCRPLVEAGADFLAVVGGVWQHPEGPVKAVEAFAKVIVDCGRA